MPDDDALKMRAEAKRCRDLAEHMATASSREMLERFAKQFEDEAERIEAPDRR